MHALFIDAGLSLPQAFCKTSEIARKLKGFVNHQEMAVRRQSTELISQSPLCSIHTVVQLLEALTNYDKDARILLHIEPDVPVGNECARKRRGEGSWLRCLHLSPSVYFDEVVEQAHAVVLAGGTMQPFSDMEQQLFYRLNKERLHAHSYGHIVPRENLLPLALSHTFSGDPLTFTLATRTSPTVMTALGKFILELCTIIPDGIIVFIPSFQ